MLSFLLWVGAVMLVVFIVIGCIVALDFILYILGDK